jgi:hypothetical protein
MIRRKDLDDNEGGENKKSEERSKIFEFFHIHLMTDERDFAVIRSERTCSRASAEQQDR